MHRFIIKYIEQLYYKNASHLTSISYKKLTNNPHIWENTLLLLPLDYKEKL